jgi:hypothetical protein
MRSIIHANVTTLIFAKILSADPLPTESELWILDLP